MASITFDIPKICKNCGFHNFKISGVIYNGSPEYTKLNVKCMRCGEKSISDDSVINTIP